MTGNSFGSLFKITSFGESHGAALGVVIEGCPAGLEFNHEELKQALQRRRPGQSEIVTQRNESDEPEILSGVFENKTLGTPITIIVRNKDQRSEDYSEIKNNPRVGHADDVWKSKYDHVDPRGGGRSSGRETVARVIGGAVAKMFVKSQSPETEVIAFTKQIGDLKTDFISLPMDPTTVWCQSTRCPDIDTAKQMEELLLKAKEDGKSYGGVAQLVVQSPPNDLGLPVFKKFKSELASAVLSIGATNGFELGAGFEAGSDEGTEFHSSNESDVYGGIRGGITTGEPIIASVSFKPTSSVLDVAKQGRHDPCIIPRACAVLEAMTYLVLADQLLWRRLDRA